MHYKTISGYCVYGASITAHQKTAKPHSISLTLEGKLACLCTILQTEIKLLLFFFFSSNAKWNTTAKDGKAKHLHERWLHQWGMRFLWHDRSYFRSSLEPIHIQETHPVNKTWLLLCQQLITRRRHCVFPSNRCGVNDSGSFSLDVDETLIEVLNWNFF